MSRRPRPPGRVLATSPFVRETRIVPTTADFRVGDRVTLDSRGMGRVIEVTAEYVVVDFGTGGRRCVPADTKGFSRL